jgi:ankyrin repeat protein
LYTTGNLDLNPRNKDNATPLQIAAENNHFEVVKRLVELGADLNTKRNDGWSPLYTAAYNGDLKLVIFLLSKGADVDGVNEVNNRLGT